MLGYIEYREAAIWIEVENQLTKIEFTYYPSKDPKNKKFDLVELKQGDFEHIPYTHILRDLAVDTEYTVKIAINNKKVARQLTFRTKKIWRYRTDPPAFSFLYGSCAYINDEPYDRSGKPYGQSMDIYKTMANTPSDFMIWGGDNLYYRPADLSNESGMRYRYHQVRSQPVLAELLASRAHYAVWDDHDYGPNDSDRSFQLKETALALFQAHWPALKYGHEETQGIFQKFNWSDVDFFLLDDRYYHSHPKMEVADKGLLGKVQLEWLQVGLLRSKAPFKIVVTGLQLLNNKVPETREGYYQYPQEREALLSFIVKQKIDNVIFLSGDRHFTEVIEQQRGTTNFVEITGSPLSSGSNKSVRKGTEANNPDRVKGSLVTEQNFIKFSVAGPLKERTLKAECINISGKVLWTQEWK